MVDVAARAPVGGPELPGLLPGSLLGEGDGRRSTRDWVVDVVAVVFSVVFGLILFFTTPDIRTAPRPLLVADMASGLLLCAGLWWRRRYPVQLGWAGAVLGVFSAMSGGAGLVALFTVAVHRRAALVIPLAVGGMVLSIPYEFLRHDDKDLPWPVNFLIIGLLTLVMTGWGMLVRARRQLVESLRDRARRAEAEQQLRVEQARQTERTRIAREMHDVLAHRISLVSLHAGALEYRAGASAADGPPAAQDVAASAAVIRASAHAALQDLREILGVLRAHDEAGLDAAERPLPTLADVPRLVAESRQAGMRVELTTLVPDAASPPAAAGRTAYRVVQEALTNARKHAAGARVSVAVSGGPGDGLSVEVRNVRPVGITRPAQQIPGSGQGLAGLAERVAVAGGRLEHGPDRDGWRVLARLPWST